MDTLNTEEILANIDRNKYTEIYNLVKGIDLKN